MQTFNLGGALAETPLRNYTTQDYQNGVEPNDNNLVIVYSIEVVDPNTNSASDLTPALNTLIQEQEEESESSGGSMGLVLIAGLLTFGLRRRIKS